MKWRLMDTGGWDRIINEIRVAIYEKYEKSPFLSHFSSILPTLRLFSKMYDPHGVHVRKICLEMCGNYFRHTTQNSDAYQTPFFGYKKSLFGEGVEPHPPPRGAWAVRRVLLKKGLCGLKCRNPGNYYRYFRDFRIVGIAIFRKMFLFSKN